MFYPYRIVLTAGTFDPGGVLVLMHTPDSDLGSLNRRVTRTATLDGGATLVNRGYSPADRTVKLDLAALPESARYTARHLLKHHNRLTLSLPDGCYSCTASVWNDRQYTLELLLTGVV